MVPPDGLDVGAPRVAHGSLHGNRGGHATPLGRGAQQRGKARQVGSLHVDLRVGGRPEALHDGPARHRRHHVLLRLLAPGETTKSLLCKHMCFLDVTIRADSLYPPSVFSRAPGGVLAEGRVRGAASHVAAADVEGDGGRPALGHKRRVDLDMIICHYWHYHYTMNISITIMITIVSIVSSSISSIRPQKAAPACGGAGAGGARQRPPGPPRPRWSSSEPIV